jgi:hypothetical protein
MARHGAKDDDTIPRLDARLCALAAEAVDAERLNNYELLVSVWKRIDKLLDDRIKACA